MSILLAQILGGIFFKDGGGNREGVRGVGIIVILRPGLVFANRGILWLSFSDVYRSAHFHEFKEFAGGILVEAKATMGAWGRPDRADMESVGGIKGHPVLHGESYITVSRTLALGAFAGNNRVAIDPKAIGHRAFVFDFIDHAKVAFRCGSFGSSDGSGRDEKGFISLEHINHPVLQRDFDSDVRGIFGFVAYGVVVFSMGSGGIAANHRKDNGAEKKQKR